MVEVLEVSQAAIDDAVNRVARALFDLSFEGVNQHPDSWAAYFCFEELDRKLFEAVDWSQLTIPEHSHEVDVFGCEPTSI